MPTNQIAQKLAARIFKLKNIVCKYWQNLSVKSEVLKEAAISVLVQWLNKAVQALKGAEVPCVHMSC